MSESASRRPLILALLALVLAGGLGAWFIWGGEDSPAPEEAPTADGSAAKEDLARRKHAARQARLDLEPVALTGVVKAEVDGKGIEGAVVMLNRKAFNQGTLSRDGRPGEPLYAVTDAKGEYRIEGVTAGRYSVSATAEGFSPATLKSFVMRGDGTQDLDLTLKQGGFSLSGLVSDVGGGPIEGVLVRVDSTEGPNFAGMNKAPLAAVTNAEGRYQTYVNEGNYVITSYHADYVGVFRMTRVEAGPRIENLELIPSAGIEGQVLSRGDRKPVEGVSITFADGRNGQSGMAFRSNFSFDGRQVLTDADGRFALSGLYPGVVQVDARGPHHAAREPVEVQVGIGETVTDVEVLLDQAFKVSGFVIPQDDPEGALADVIVGAYTLQPFTLIASSTPSDSDGYFEIHGLEPGAYTIGALSEDALPKIAGVGIEVKDADIDDVIVELDQGVHVKGRVTPPEIAQIDVTIDSEKIGFGNMFDVVGVMFAGTRSAEDGTFDVGPLKPGNYKIIAKGNSGAAATVELEVPAEGLENYEIQLDPKASVAGFVVDESGAPMAGVNVELVAMARKGPMDFGAAARGGVGRGFPTGEDGSYVARGYDAGEYMVSVTDRRGRRMALAGEEAGIDEEVGGAELLVELADAEQRSNFTITLVSTNGEIGGVVLDGDGLPVADAWVRAGLDIDQSDFGEMVGPARPKAPKKERNEGVLPPQEEDEGPRDFSLPEYFAEPPVLTDAAGHFVIKNLRPSKKYVVVAEGDKGGSKVREGGVTPGSTLTLTLQSLATLEGKVTGDKGPVDEYTITLRGPNPRSKRVRSADGRYSFERLEAGEYELRVDANAGTAKAEVELAAEQKASVDLELEGFGQIEGTLVDALEGKPIAKMMVMVIPEDGGFDPSQAMAMMMGAGTKTDSDGEFTARKVKAGKGMVVFMDPSVSFGSGGGAVAQADYEIEAGETLDLGEVRGINSAVVDKEGRGELGMNTRELSWDDRPRPPGTDLDAEEEEPTGDPRERLWVVWVDVGGPADEAGIQPGDEITSIDGKSVESMGARAADMLLSPNRLQLGQEVQLELDRGGKTQSARVEAGPAED